MSSLHPLLCLWGGPISSHSHDCASVLPASLRLLLAHCPRRITRAVQKHLIRLCKGGYQGIPHSLGGPHVILIHCWVAKRCSKLVSTAISLIFEEKKTHLTLDSPTQPPSLPFLHEVHPPKFLKDSSCTVFLTSLGVRSLETLPFRGRVRFRLYESYSTQTTSVQAEHCL